MTDHPIDTTERPERTDIDEDSDNPKTSQALGTITFGGGAAPFAGVIAAPEEKLEEPGDPVDANDSTDPRGL